MGKYTDKTLKVAKEYAAKFGLRWEDDVSEWEEDIGPSIGGAYDDKHSFHEPPVIYVMSPTHPDPALRGKIFIAAEDETKPFSYLMVHVAIASGKPLHAQ
jgi:hypothetical protein